MTESQIYLGIGLIFALGVGCQVVAGRLRLPAIVLLLPVGFVAGTITQTVNARTFLGSAFTPMVTLGIAVILFDGGLELEFAQLEGHNHRVVRRLLYWGIPLTWAGAGLLAWALLGLSTKAAVMLGAIVIVSGPTVVGPLLQMARPGRRLTGILGWESTTIDPIGAIIGVLVFTGLQSGGDRVHLGHAAAAFGADIGVGLLGGAVGAAALWFLLGRVKLSGILATEVTLAAVVAAAGFCNAIRADTGLLAAITMGVALANLPGVERPQDRPFFATIVQLVVAVLFITISASVTPSQLRGVLGPTLVLVVGLIVVVRPVVALTATVRTDLTWPERTYVAMMDPRGIVAASTAATFGPALAAVGIGGAQKLVPATFVVIVGTVTFYGLTAVPAARRLGLTAEEPAPAGPAPDGPDPDGPAPTSPEWPDDPAAAARPDRLAGGPAEPESPGSGDARGAGPP